MKVKVLSEKGQILSVGYIDQPHNVEDDVPFDFGPVGDGGQTVSEVDLPEEYLNQPLTDVTVDSFLKRLQADVQKKK